MEQAELIPHLFRTEDRKIVSVLCKLFGIAHIEVAEDITSDTFLLASEVWGLKGLPENPAAWLYTVAKNKSRDHLKRHALFTQSIYEALRRVQPDKEEPEIDLSPKNINDSQLAMMFVVCHPCNSPEAQIGLALNLLCGFGVEEIANAFLTNKVVIYKRLQRAKEKLKAEQIKIEPPGLSQIEARIDVVLMTLYLLFNEGYYSAHQNTAIRRELCFEAIRLTHLLVDEERTNVPAANALLSLMYLQASRFNSRLNPDGEMILYQDQDTDLWNYEFISRGEHFLKAASQGHQLSKYHLEAGIAYWHTTKEDTNEKWEAILQLYNELLVIAYSPVAALNRTYALAKVKGRQAAISEAEKINLTGNSLFHSLLGELYAGIDTGKALQHWNKALELARSPSDRKLILKRIAECS